jgi:hypothetical protein
MSANYSRRHLQWVRDGAAWVVRNGGTELVRVVPDEKYPGMWRVRSPDGRLSDMANITWAKDAAATMALAVLNRPGDVGIDGGDGTQKEKTKSAVRVLPDTGRAPRHDGEAIYSRASRRPQNEQAHHPRFTRNHPLPTPSSGGG